MAIQHAALGQEGDAIAHAQAAVTLLERTGKPQAAWFAHHLHAYREAGPAGAETPELPWPGATVATTDDMRPAGPPAVAKAARGPRLLDMAFAAAQSMAQFLGSGWKTATSETKEQRLRACASCSTPSPSASSCSCSGTC